MRVRDPTSQATASEQNMQVSPVSPTGQEGRVAALSSETRIPCPQGTAFLQGVHDGSRGRGHPFPGRSWSPRCLCWFHPLPSGHRASFMVDLGCEEAGS